MKNRTTPDNIKKLAENEVIIFGSNAKGDHAGGLAAYCKKYFKAKQGISRGMTGQCYAIDTMSGLEILKEQIETFISVAKATPDKTFLVTLIGCGIAGYTPEQIAPLFKEARDIENIHFPKEFWTYLSIKGYKVFNSDFTCRDLKYEVGKEYTHKGKIQICQSGLHFCLKASDCFGYYDFNSNNIVCEVEALGKVQYHSDDTKVVTDHLHIVKRLTWAEVLFVANEGKDNTGHSNSGYSNSGNRNSGNWNSGDRNSGNWNSGNWNSGDRNSGDSNSGYRNSGDSNSGDSNSGYRNSGDSNSGYRNSGNWNSGYRNSGDSNSGYRNSGAFCTDENPVVYLFNKPTKMKVKNWENSKAYSIMGNLDLTVLVQANIMTEQEKKDHPKYETTEGYLKTIPYKEAWSNLWGNLSDKDKKAFTSLPNFTPSIFEEITGIKLK